MRARFLTFLLTPFDDLSFKSRLKDNDGIAEGLRVDQDRSPFRAVLMLSALRQTMGLPIRCRKGPQWEVQ
jgi:hypothetical protein